jgi:hypothetical protein
MIHMMDRLDHAIRAGVMGGIVLVVLSLLGTVLTFCGLNLILGLVAILTAAGTGVMAARLARHHIGGLMETIVLSGMAGAIAGAIDGILHVVLSLVRPGFNSNSIFGFLGNEVSALTCAPFVVILYIAIIAIIAMIGGAIYAAVSSDIS